VRWCLRIKLFNLCSGWISIYNINTKGFSSLSKHSQGDVHILCHKGGGRGGFRALMTVDDEREGGSKALMTSNIYFFLKASKLR